MVGERGRDAVVRQNPEARDSEKIQEAVALFRLQGYRKLHSSGKR